MSAYEGLARFYDGLTRDVDYTQWRTGTRAGSDRAGCRSALCWT